MTRLELERATLVATAERASETADASLEQLCAERMTFQVDVLLVVNDFVVVLHVFGDNDLGLMLISKRRRCACVPTCSGTNCRTAPYVLHSCWY